MSPAEYILHSQHVVTPEGAIAAAVRVRDGRIAAVIPTDTPPAGAEALDELWLLPGLVDTHVHVNEPGRTEWEGWASASRAALAGGVTTIVDMPLNSVPATTTLAALEAKREAASRALGDGVHVDARFWGGVVPGNVRELDRLAGAGALGFKCFLVPSGVDEFPPVTGADLREAMPEIARLGLPLLAHAELWAPIEAAAPSLKGRDPREYATWLASRPAASEVEAIRQLVRLSAEFLCPVHIVHVSSADALPELRAARGRGVAITSETCPHYLTFAAEDVLDGSTAHKCAPPIRARAHRDALWEALRHGTLDLVASDHSPCPPALKRLDTGDFFAAWGGIASLELGLSAVWTEARGRGFTLADVVRWMAAAPAKLAGLAERKGRIAVGADADLVVFDPDAAWTVDQAKLRQRHPLTPYHGRRIIGRVLSCSVAGTFVQEADL